jgi:hypothetical protein
MDGPTGPELAFRTGVRTPPFFYSRHMRNEPNVMNESNIITMTDRAHSGLHSGHPTFISRLSLRMKFEQKPLCLIAANSNIRVNRITANPNRISTSRISNRNKNRFFNICASMLFFGFAMFLAACGNTGGGTSDNVAPTIAAQPASTSVAAGKTATFSVTANGTAPLSYQWKKGTTNVGTNSASYTTPATTSSDNGDKFSVTVTNSFGNITSSTATLTVTAPDTKPAITTQPANITVSAGQTATFTVDATGTAPLTYQWMQGTTIVGSSSASYTTPATTSSNSGEKFSVTVSNSAGSITSSMATLTVTAAATKPSITTQPANVTVNAGLTANFSVVATGTAPLTYQWLQGTTKVGTNSASYTTPATTSGNNGEKFSVTVSNSAGSTTSSMATLTVNTPATKPSITTQPANVTVTVGQMATFTVAANGTAPLSYQWTQAGANVGTNSTSYTTPATKLTDNGAAIQVTVSNSVGSTPSNTVTLSVIAPPPSSVNVLTYHNDIGRTGQNLNETILTTSSVNSTNFGKKSFLSTDGLVDAEPLYVSNLNIGGSTHNVVFVATEHDSVYAFDADTFGQLWKVSMLGSGETTSDPVGGCGQVQPEIGITSTPVIDLNAGPNGTIYVVAMSRNQSTNPVTYIQRIHALDITTGVDIAGSPVTIQASFPGQGANSNGTNVIFDPRQCVAHTFERGGLYRVGFAL